MKYWTYILETEKGTLYTGVAIDVEKRFQEHLEGSAKGKKGAKYTNSNKPVKIVYKKVIKLGLAPANSVNNQHVSRFLSASIRK